MNKLLKIEIVILLIVIITIPIYSYAQIDTGARQRLDEIENKLEKQESINSSLTMTLAEVLEAQKEMLEEVKKSNVILSDLSACKVGTPDGFKDAFVLDHKGVPFAFIDNMLTIYGYESGNLLGWIDNESMHVIRNFDQSPVAIIDGDFFIDEAGHPIGSIERSETLKWDREKMYSKIQKTPVSHFFVMNNPRQVFIPTEFRFNSWSPKHISTYLYFDVDSIQSQR